MNVKVNIEDLNGPSDLYFYILHSSVLHFTFKEGTMTQEKFTMFRNRLQKNFRHLNKQAKKLKISCYRVYDHDIPEFPFCIEFYDDKLSIAEYKRRDGMDEEEHDAWLEHCLGIIGEILNVSPGNIFLRIRQRKPGRLGQYQKLGEEKHEFIVHENGLKFIVNLSDYLDTGLFLDHRTTREKIRAEVKDRKILNLFCYTGSFSVYGASGGALEVVSVDLSKTYLQWAEKNMELNGFMDESKYKFVHADVLQFLKSVEKGSFDLVILDPPTFSNSKRMKDFLDIQKDHVVLINQCLDVMKKDGILYFSTNSSRFILDKEKLNSLTIRDITKGTTAFDFRSKFSRFCFKIEK